jgi:hypothetical protein
MNEKNRIEEPKEKAAKTRNPKPETRKLTTVP